MIFEQKHKVRVKRLHPAIPSAWNLVLEKCKDFEAETLIRNSKEASVGGLEQANGIAVGNSRCS